MNETIRVLVVDDAAFMRRSLTKLLTKEPAVEIVGEASNGFEAFKMCAELRPDVVCLDIDMPEMDGITAIKHIMSNCPSPIVVVSSMTDRENIPFEALRLGVMDFFPKPSSLAGEVAEQVRHLLYLIRNAHRVRRDRIRRIPLKAPAAIQRPSPTRCRHMIVVGGTLGSVGGLIQLFAQLPPTAEAGVGIIFQTPLHPVIADSFLASVEEYLGWEVTSPEFSTITLAGRAVFVRPGFCVFLDKGSLTLEEEMTGHCLDRLFTTTALHFGANSTMIVLAGDQPSGLEGLKAARQHGALCFVQDEKTAMFSDWSPQPEEGDAPLIDLDDIIASVRTRIGVGEAPQ